MTQAFDRRAAVARLLQDRRDLLIVAGLGSPTYDVAAAGDHPLNYYLWGAMGGAAMVGLGLALAQPRRPVLVVTGDGELLMGLGSLATKSSARTRSRRRTRAISRSRCSTTRPMARPGARRATPAMPPTSPRRRAAAGSLIRESSLMKVIFKALPGASTGLGKALPWASSKSIKEKRRESCRRATPLFSRIASA